MKILVVGDRIFDHYKWCKAIGLSPEACAPKLVVEKEETREGGASLVAENLKSLLGVDAVLTEFGSVSNKTRIFADRQLVCRIDQDSFSLADQVGFWGQIQAKMNVANAVVVGDYGKGAMSEGVASGILAFCLESKKPLFVDAKDGIEKYKGCFAIFPNENEHTNIERRDYQHIIRKLGPLGCSVDGNMVSTEQQQVYDVTGAGDVFIAAFVWRYMVGPAVAFFSEEERLRDAANYANKAAGISVRHLGTYIVKPGEIRLAIEGRASSASGAQ